MSSIIEQAILFFVKQFVTQDMVKAAEKAFLDYLKQLAATTPTKIDDEVLKVIAEALGLES